MLSEFDFDNQITDNGTLKLPPMAPETNNTILEKAPFTEVNTVTIPSDYELNELLKLNPQSEKESYKLNENLNLLFDHSIENNFIENSYIDESSSIEYCNFLENIKKLDKDQSVICLCTQVLKNKKLFSKHKMTCKTFIDLENFYRSSMIKYLTQNYFYQQCLKNILLMGNFENWFNDLNSNNHHYILFTTKLDKIKKCTYKTIKCHAYKIKYCSFSINMTIFSDNKFTKISFSGFHNHAPDETYTDKSGNVSNLLLKNKKLDIH